MRGDVLRVGLRQKAKIVASRNRMIARKPSLLAGRDRPQLSFCAPNLTESRSACPAAG
jgi:hypothetical protein